MVSAYGAKLDVKEIGAIVLMAIALLLVLPFILKQVISSSLSGAGSIVKETTNIIKETVAAPYHALTDKPEVGDLETTVTPSFDISPKILAAMGLSYVEKDPEVLLDVGITSIVGSCPKGYYREYFGETCKPTETTQLSIDPDAQYIIPEVWIEIAGEGVGGATCPDGYYRPMFSDVCQKGDKSFIDNTTDFFKGLF